MTATFWRCGRTVIDLTRGPVIMGILNVTPDSFSDGGEHDDLESALNWARRMRAEGAQIIDVGGESTRPGAGEVPLDEERRRVIPVVKALAAEGFFVSVDTSRPEIMTEAAAAGAQILNDVRAFELPGALEAAAATECGLVVMHWAHEPLQGDVVAEVQRYLEDRQAALEAAGVAPERICWDPGFGFGKGPVQNFELLAATARFAASGQPFMTAVSRKRSLGRVTGREDPQERAAASAAAALLCVERGAQIVRVHDVRETADAFAVLRALREAERRIELRALRLD